MQTLRAPAKGTAMGLTAMKITGRWFGFIITAGMVILVAQVVVVISLAWAAAFIGDTEMLADLMDRDVFDPPATWRMIGGIFLTLPFVCGVIYLVVGLHRLRRVARKSGLASAAAGRALRQSGIGMIVMWFGLICLNYFLPMLMFGSREAEPEWAIAIFDLDFLMLLVGVALLSVSQLAEEAEALRAENEQFV